MTNTAIQTRRWNTKSALEQIEKCGFECEGGPLESNDAYIWLKSALEVGPEFMPGQGVWFEVEATTAGVPPLRQWVHFYIIGCQMESSTDRRFWTYSLSFDPPEPYHYGTIHFCGIRGERLRLENPMTRD